MSNAALNHVWNNSTARGSELVAMLAIADMANDEGDCWPGRTNLAKKCRVSKRRLQAITAKMEKAGELAVFTNDGKQTRTGKTNRYRIIGVNETTSLNAEGVNQTTPPGVTPATSLNAEGMNQTTPPGVTPATSDPSGIDPSSKIDPSFDPSSSEAHADESTDPPTLCTDDEFNQLVEKRVKSLGLNADAFAALMERGQIVALATQRCAEKNAKTNRAGYAARLVDNGGPPDEFLEWASFAVEFKTLDDSEIDREINKMSLTVLVEETNAIAQTQRPQPNDQAVQVDDTAKSITGGEKTPLERWQDAVSEICVELEIVAQFAGFERDEHHDDLEWAIIQVGPGQRTTPEARTLHQRLRDLNLPGGIRFCELEAVPV